MPADRRSPADARLLVVAAAVLWGTTGTARALGPDAADPEAVGAARLVVGGAGLALLGWRLGWLGPGTDAPGPGTDRPPPTPVRRAGAGAEQPARTCRADGTAGTDHPGTGAQQPGPARRSGAGAEQLARTCQADAVGTDHPGTGRAEQPAPARRSAGTGNRPAPTPARTRGALAVAAAAMAGYQPLFFGGVARTGVAVGTMVGIGSAPVFAGLLGLAVRGERPGRRWAAATGLALAGTLLLVGAGDAADVDPAGVVLALGAGAAYAVYVAASKALLDTGRAPDTVTVRVFGLAALALVPVAAVAGIGPLLTAGGLLTIAHLGLVTVVVAYVLFGRGLAGVGVATAGTLTLAEPATATVLGVAVLGERPGPAAAAGLALVAAGLVVLVARGGRAHRGAGPEADVGCT